MAERRYTPDALRLLADEVGDRTASGPFGSWVTIQRALMGAATQIEALEKRPPITQAAAEGNLRAAVRKAAAEKPAAKRKR